RLRWRISTTVCRRCCPSTSCRVRRFASRRWCSVTAKPDTLAMSPKARLASAAVRLRDIAEQAGVSVNTVSRALTDKPDINPATRARVRALAERLGYTPNMLARSLLRGSTRTIGLVVTDCTDPFYAGLIRAVENTLSRESFGLLLATSNENVDKERQALAMLRERRVDGLL